MMDNTASRFSPLERRSWLRRLVRLLLLSAFLLLLTPFVLVIVYRSIDPPVSALMLWRQLQGVEITHSWRPIDTLSANLITAVAASEDGRICEHNGVDWDVLEGLIERRIEQGDRNVRGGSTIAMQTAKNLFLWPHRSYLRKALEIPIAQWIGLIWSKQRLMEIYINIAEWGPGVFGAEAAMQHHFNRNAKSTTKRQATLLASALPAPLIRQAGKPHKRLSARAKRLERRLPAAKSHLTCLFPQ